LVIFGTVADLLFFEGMYVATIMLFAFVQITLCTSQILQNKLLPAIDKPNHHYLFVFARQFVLGRCIHCRCLNKQQSSLAVSLSFTSGDVYSYAHSGRFH